MGSPEVHNVLVLVGGTVEPLNLGSAHRSAGYSRPGVASGDPSYWSMTREELARSGLTDSQRWYWETNEALRAAISDLEASYTSLAVFPSHGWSGDNSPFNRRVAGKYLADRLAGAEGEAPYYAALLDDEVHFHLLGHSHGGNVINELCQEAARVWPDRWRIRTILYLSTPFFTRLHQVDTGAFHGEAKVVNVKNDLDLTQRVLADFNLLHLHGILGLSSFAGVGRAMSDLMSTAGTSFAGLRADLQPMVESYHLVDADPGWGIDVEQRFGAAPSSRVYAHVISLVAKLRDLFRSIRPVVQELHRGIEYPASREYVGRVGQGRQLLSDALRDRWLAILRSIEASLDTTHRSFTSRLASGVFPVSGVLADFDLPALRTLTRHLRVGPYTPGTPTRGSLSSPITDLLVDTLLEQVDVFDDTVTSPADQLAGTPFASRIVEVDVTDVDDYRGNRVESDRALELLDRLARIEARYAATSIPDHLVDLMLHLIVHHEPARTAILAAWPTVEDTYGWLSATPSWLLGRLPGGLRSLLPFVRVAWFWLHHLVDRHLGRLQVQPPARSPFMNGTADPYKGDLAYLAVVSHSQSRFDLYDDVRRTLEGQLTTRRRRPRR